MDCPGKQSCYGKAILRFATAHICSLVYMFKVFQAVCVCLACLTPVIYSETLPFISELFGRQNQSFARDKPYAQGNPQKDPPNPSGQVFVRSASFLDTAGAKRRLLKFRRAEKIYNQGDLAKSVKYIRDGGVRLSAINESGKEAVVAVLGPGDFFGEEECLAGQRVCIGTATAILPTSVLSIDKDEMTRVRRTEHALSDRFISHILTRNIRIEEDLVDQLFNSGEKCLARSFSCKRAMAKTTSRTGRFPKYRRRCWRKLSTQPGREFS
jgi:CRP/FNR family transcriptional regulator, cyclic AMP receptor protein